MIITYTMFFYNLLKIKREVPTQPPHVQPQQDLNLANIQTLIMTYIMCNMYKLCLIPRAHLVPCLNYIALLKIERAVNDAISTCETC